MKNTIINEKDGITLKGEYVFTVAEISTAEQKKIYKKIEKLRSEGKDFFDLVKKLNSICSTRVYRIPNTITSVAKTMIANNLASVSPDNDMRINYSALGTDNTTVSVNDTTLVAEAYRRTVATNSNNGSVVNLSAFYGSTEVDGTFYEHALFSDGTVTTDSGIMISRVLLNGGSGITKSTSETLTIDYIITIN